jgi:DUF1009 family protein
MPPKLGIVAGGGDLPGILVRACRAAGRPFFVVALKGLADPALAADAPHAWARIGAMGAIVRTLRREGVRELVFAGATRRPSPLRLMPDWRALRFLLARRTWRLGDGRLLNALVEALEREEGFRVAGAHEVAPGLLAQAGPVGRVAPDAAALGDIAVGRREALALGAADRGQAVVVRLGRAIAREDREGTDALLRRCRGLPGRGGVLVKLPKPLQDRRVDLPTVGAWTVAGAAAAGLAGIAVEAGGALIVDRAAVAEAADRAGLFVVGIAPEPGTA